MGLVHLLMAGAGTTSYHTIYISNAMRLQIRLARKTCYHQCGQTRLPSCAPRRGCHACLVVINFNPRESSNAACRGRRMKQWIGVVGAVFIGTQVNAQSDATSGTAFYPSCLAAADIVQGKRPAADSEDAAKQLRQASACFGAVTAIMKLEPFLKPEFAVCPPPDILPDSKDILAQMILSITAYLKSHPEQRSNNFHQTALTALVAAWPCSK